MGNAAAAATIGESGNEERENGGRHTHRFDSSAGISNDGYVLFSGEIDLKELEKNIRAWSTRLSI